MSSNVIKTFPILYHEDTRGKERQWTTWVQMGADGFPEIVSESGCVGGKLSQTSKAVRIITNAGKKNERSPTEKACADAEKKWTDKRDKERFHEKQPATNTTTSKPVLVPKKTVLVPKKKLAVKPKQPVGIGDIKKDKKHLNKVISDAVVSVATDKVDIALQDVRPMLANNYKDKKHYIVFPASVQPKIDGVRCLSFRDRTTGKIRMMTRKGVDYKNFPTISDEIDKIIPKDNFTWLLDGELYTDQIEFNKLNGLCRKKTLRAGDKEQIELIEYHCFDLIVEKQMTISFIERQQMLSTLLNSSICNKIKLVETLSVSDHDQIKENMIKYLSNGYEGIMIRNNISIYKSEHRSNDLIKYKDFVDAEWSICGAKEGAGGEEGCIIWQCVTDAGDKFWCRPRGSREDRMELWEQFNQDASQFIGKLLTIRYQDLSPKNIPRFPVGIAIRCDL